MTSRGRDRAARSATGSRVSPGPAAASVARAAPAGAATAHPRPSVPVPADRQGWVIEECPERPLRRRVAETVLTLGAGGLATRGAVEETLPGASPMVLMAGVYTGEGSAQHLLPAPIWTHLETDPPPGRSRQVLDLEAGVLLREEHGPERPLRTLRFVSVARPGVVAMRAEAPTGRISPGGVLSAPDGTASETGKSSGHEWAQTFGHGGITALADQVVVADGRMCTVDRIAVYQGGTDGPPEPRHLRPSLELAARLGFDGLLAEQRAAWHARWDAVDVTIPGDPEAELAFRFALFQLWCNVTGTSEIGVGARGLSGSGYAGHVFWDADVFVLPAMTSIDPTAARAMLDYRLRRLPAARRAARADGREGARFPWESALSGADVTPEQGYLGGVPIAIRTGRLEEHITADVAWAAWHYGQWCGDTDFRRGPGARLLADTARYWASRCRVDPSGRAHVDAVIGPDEYHEAVNDNAFTNVMARWNLRAAAGSRSPASDEGDECRRWRSLASSLVDGYRCDTGLYEQFAGFFDLEPLRAAEVASPPFAADIVLGHERTAGAQLIKQPDVLMLHHLVPEEVVPGSLGPNLDYYGPRTTHGSSLSPGISAALLARAGRPDEALALLRTALRLDLDDLTAMTAAGLHLATMGAAWQALLFGFLGARVRHGVLTLDPRLPIAWPSLEVRFICLGRRLRVRVDADSVDLTSDAPIRVRLVGHPPRHLASTLRLDRRAST